MMKTTSTESSTFVKRVAYCSDCKTLRIKFVRGGVYEYSDVPAWLHTELITAHSVGRYFQTNIKGRFVCTCLVAPDDTTGTLRFRLDKHVCHSPQVIPIQDPQTEIAARMFGSTVEVVYRIKGDSNIYTSRQLLEKAIADKEAAQTRNKLLTVMIRSGEMPSNFDRARFADFIMKHRQAIKEIL